MAEILTEILTETMKSHTRDAKRVRRNYAQDAKALLQKRFRERLRLEDVARALYVSPFHLCRLFKEETGLPMHRYLNLLRLRHALRELVQGEAGLADLAIDLGFCCQSHFTRVFRKEFGVSPGEARRRAKDRREVTPT
jgi:AraC family transcriptional regulator